MNVGSRILYNIALNLLTFRIINIKALLNLLKMCHISLLFSLCFTNTKYCLPQQRLQGANRKHLCCLCCKSGPIEASFCIDRQGFVPGEAMKLFAEISNGASREMDKSYVTFKMV